MVVTVKKNEFIAGLRKAAAAIDGKGNFSVSVKINKNGGLKLILYTAGSFYANIVMPCEACGQEGETSVVVPREILNAANALSKLGDEFTLDFSDNNLKLSCGSGVITVDYIADGLVADLPGMARLGSICLSTEDFKKSISVVKNSIDPAQRGAVLHWKNCIGLIPVKKDDVKKILVTASCTLGISVTELNVDSVELEGDMPSLAIPVGALSTIISSLSGEKCKINIMAKKSGAESVENPSPAALYIADDKTSYVLMLLSEKYPEKITQSISSIVPGCKFKALMDKEELSNAIRVASFGESKKGISIKVVNDGYIRVSSSHGESYVDVKAHCKGDMEETRLNPYYLERIVNAYSGDKVAILTNSDTGMAAASPMMSKIILVSGGEEGDSLIMPINDATADAMAKTEEARRKSEKEEAEKEAALEK